MKIGKKNRSKYSLKTVGIAWQDTYAVYQQEYKFSFSNTHPK